MKNIRAYLKKWLRSEQGVALIEFAIVFPVMFLLLFGCIEVNRLILTELKHEKAGYAIADIITQYQSPTHAGAAGELSMAELTNNVFPQYSRIMYPYNDETRQAVIVTSIEKSPSGAKSIHWQVVGGGTLTGCDGQAEETCVVSAVNGRTPSEISTAVVGTSPSFTGAINGPINAFTMAGSTNIIVTETFYYYEPILQRLLQSVGQAGGAGFAGFRYFLQPKIFVKRTYFIPRSGDLYDLPPTFPVP